ncbi:MAG: FecR domain-containing protein [Gracilimonas sp.]|uniref:FecR family protein n=1 Tax=Gracilimonas sp. TaxID=1974203 RepID=UPI001B2C2EDC|nr:FecR family protein [Gracilimonas sp.]MBO6585176.1 FecR domain-containing protein [Gracilimonas sp.]MBO6615552.1 FecR domain-containing protein [Gracilimonas sp.]
MSIIKKKLYAFIVLLVVAGFALPEIARAQSERPIAIVKRFKPDVTLQNLEVDKYIELNLEENKGERLFDGDSLTTNEEGFALVVFMDASVAKVKPSSLLILNGSVATASKAMNTRINLKNGEIFLNVEPQGGNDFEVATSRSLASVQGTDFGSRFDGFVWVEEGQVDVMALNSGETVSLFDQMFAQVDEQGNSVESGTLTSEELSDLGEGYDEMENDLVQKEIILRFRDQNGQLREVRIDVFEESDN